MVFDFATYISTKEAMIGISWLTHMHIGKRLIATILKKGIFFYFFVSYKIDSLQEKITVKWSFGQL